jgi:TRAP-type uncharacterized transport system fused permease subunit
MGGVAWYVVWTVLTALVGLAAFAAALEGYMFTHMAWYSRLLVLIGLVLIFSPSFMNEMIGMGLMLTVLIINWTRSRQNQATLAGAG